MTGCPAIVINSGLSAFGLSFQYGVINLWLKRATIQFDTLALDTAKQAYYLDFYGHKEQLRVAE